MKMNAPSTFILLIASYGMSYGPGNFKIGDSWDYSFEKTFFSVTASSFVTQNVIVGKTAFILDSIVKNTDSSFWYFTRTDSALVRKTGTGGNEYLQGSSNLLIVYVVNDRMSGGNGAADFFSFYQLPDSSSAAAGSGFKRVTVDTNLTINDMQHHALQRTVSSWSHLQSSSSSSDESSYDSTFWIDSIGLFQKISYRSSSFKDNVEINETTRHESYILVSRNGMGLVVPPVATAEKDKYLCRYETAKDAPCRFFSLQGRTLGRRSVHALNHCVVIQQFPGGRCLVKPLIR